jgi:Family of unknown function (DUF6982)
LAGSTTKKAVIHRFEKEPVVGHVNPVSYQQPTGIEMLSEQGTAMHVPYPEIRNVAFVRSFDEKTESTRRIFNTRPKMEGLWVSLEFRDGVVMEGIMTNNLLQVEHYGFTIIPPDPSGNHQRIFVPRAALRSVAVLGVIGSPLRKRKGKPAVKEQIGLFEE